MPTLEEVQSWLKGQGFAVPAFVVVMWLELLSEKVDCMQAAGYAPGAVKLAMLHSLALFGLASGNRYISSQSAPNGASRGFKIKDAGEAWRGHLHMLRTFDPAGCLEPVLPDSPEKEKRAALFVGIGGCYHDRKRGRRYE